jgi:hypothetical protein
MYTLRYKRYGTNLSTVMVAPFPEYAFLIDKKKQICALPAWSSGIVSACGVWVVRSNPVGVWQLLKNRFASYSTSSADNGKYETVSLPYEFVNYMNYLLFLQTCELNYYPLIGLKNIFRDADIQKSEYI